MMTGRQNQTPNWRWLTAIAMCVSLLSGILISESAKAQNVVNRETSSPKTALATYATDLIAAAEQDRFNSIEAKRELTDRALQVLASEQKNNPVVISDSQAVRDVVVIGVAQRLVAGDVPESLAGKRLFKLNLEKLFHDSSNAEELKNNLSAILSDVAKSEARVILIIDPDTLRIRTLNNLICSGESLGMAARPCFNDVRAQRPSAQPQIKNFFRIDSIFEVKTQRTDRWR